MTPQQVVDQIALAYHDGYLRQLAVLEGDLEKYESEAGRQQLAIDEPETYRIFEGHTREEREQRIEVLATGVGVAHAILAAARLQS